MARPTRRASSRRSRQVEQGTVGTHVARKVQRSSSSHTIRNSMNFSSRAAAARQRTGEISQVMPHTSSRETAAAYAQRSRQRGFVLNTSRQGRWRSYVLVALVAALLLVVALGVTWLVYKGQMGAKMHLNDAALAEVLSAPEEENAPYYVLLTGTFEDSMRENDGPHLISLVRVDPLAAMVTVVNLPHNIETTMSDDEYHILSYAEILGGNTELVTQVENVCGVEISHIIKLNDTSFTTIVDSLGGLTLNLAEEADDPDTGSIYIPAGEQSLNGEQALVLVRCDNYTTPLATRAMVQAQVMEALASKLLGKSSIGLLQSLDTIASNVETTMTFDDVWALVKALRDADKVTFYSSIVPGQTSVDPDGIFYSIARAAFDNMMEAVDEGRNPDEAATISGLTPSIVKISVKNGAGITGGASQLAELLESAGYQVPETGNAENYVYDETLVVYKNDLYKPTAEDVLAVIGNGRTIEAGLFYEFDTDILVIIGKDWIPQY